MQLHLKNIEIHNFKGLDDVSLTDCGRINALVGKNNSGKSSILHAIDMACLALEVNSWDRFQPKLQVKDLFKDAGTFSVDFKYEDNTDIKITANPQFGPIKSVDPTDNQNIKSILIWPDVGAGMHQRRHQTPHNIIQQVENRNFNQVDSLQILYAIKYYALREERGLTVQTYDELINEIKHYFPDISDVESDRTETDIATLTYEEYGEKIDILYSGSGLKHFIDILLKATISNAKIILLDEPEMGLHPDLQRQFIDYLKKLAFEKNMQIFIATHSPVLLNYADSIQYFRVINNKGARKVLKIPNDAVHTLWSDVGIRPSDIFNQDICLLVEGASEIVFFEHIIRTLYEKEFANIGVGILQYGGSAADGIINGHIDVSNIVAAQKYTYWLRDRDAPGGDIPSTSSTKFKNALYKQNIECRILQKREIEFYYPRDILISAQQGDSVKEKLVISILNGSQNEKFRTAASKGDICVPSGKYLRKLLKNHIKHKSQIGIEIRYIIERKLIPWVNEILG